MIKLNRSATATGVKMEKRCSKCKLEKPIIFFNKDKSKKDGLYPICKGCRKEYWLKKNFDISLKEYNDILERQGNMCAICETKKPNGRGWNVDHDHETGEIRGILCSSCNRALGLFKDNPLILINAIRYLKWM